MFIEYKLCLFVFDKHGIGSLLAFVAALLVASFGGNLSIRG